MPINEFEENWQNRTKFVADQLVNNPEWGSGPDDVIDEVIDGGPGTYEVLVNVGNPESSMGPEPLHGRGPSTYVDGCTFRAKNPYDAAHKAVLKFGMDLDIFSIRQRTSDKDKGGEVKKSKREQKYEKMMEGFDL